MVCRYRDIQNNPDLVYQSWTPRKVQEDIREGFMLELRFKGRLKTKDLSLVKNITSCE